MKKALVVTALISTIGLATIQIATAAPGPGANRSLNHPGATQNTQLDQETLDKIRTFHTENQALRKQIVEKQAAHRAVMQNTNPNATLAAKLSGELFDLRNTMHQKAKTAGLNGIMMENNGRGGYGRGYGMNNGFDRGHGYGMNNESERGCGHGYGMNNGSDRGYGHGYGMGYGHY
jgi:hypothetical protein